MGVGPAAGGIECVVQEAPFDQHVSRSRHVDQIAAGPAHFEVAEHQAGGVVEVKAGACDAPDGGIEALPLPAGELAGSGGQKDWMTCWPLMTSRTPATTRSTTATSPEMIVPDEGLAPGRLDMGCPRSRSTTLARRPASG